MNYRHQDESYVFVTSDDGTMSQGCQWSSSPRNTTASVAEVTSHIATVCRDRGDVAVSRNAANKASCTRFGNMLVMTNKEMRARGTDAREHFGFP